MNCKLYLMSDRWFLTSFHVSVEVEDEAEAKQLFERASEAIQDVLGDARAWSVYMDNPQEADSE